MLKKNLVKIVSSILIATSVNCGSEEVLDFEVKRTNKNGVVDFAPPKITIKNMNGHLENILVYNVKGEGNSLSVAIDPSGKHLPQRVEISDLKDEINGSYGLSKSALLAELIITMGIVRELGSAYEDEKKNKDNFIGEDENVNKYCVSLDQMLYSNINVPMGLVGVASNEIKVASLKPLRWLFEKYVEKKFGKLEGYEVWVPKTGVNLCGEDYSEIVCKIDKNYLSEKLWKHNDVPVWEIKGGCYDTKVLNNNNNNNDDNNDNNDNNDNEVINLGEVLVDKSDSVVIDNEQVNEHYPYCYTNNDCYGSEKCETVCMTKHDQVIYESESFSCSLNLCEKASGGIAECRMGCK